MIGFLIVNPHSGSAGGTDELLARAEALGVETHVLRPATTLPLLHLYATAGLVRPEWRDLAAATFLVEARAGRRIRAAVDGEPATFETPIRFRIQPQALRLLVPRGPDPEHLVLAAERHLAR